VGANGFIIQCINNRGGFGCHFMVHWKASYLAASWVIKICNGEFFNLSVACLNCKPYYPVHAHASRSITVIGLLVCQSVIHGVFMQLQWIRHPPLSCEHTNLTAILRFIDGKKLPGAHKHLHFEEDIQFNKRTTLSSRLLQVKPSPKTNASVANSTWGNLLYWPTF